MAKGKKKKVVEVELNGEAPAFKNGTKKVMTKKQIRARARRGQKITEAELDHLYKPVEEWDEEELARGRPRAADGTFRGKSPSWITRQQYEDAMSRFKGIVEARMREETVTALGVIHGLLADDDIDEKGRPLVSASTKLEAAKFLIEHAVGKPLQRTETDISVKLQGLLAVATAAPTGGAFAAAELDPGQDYRDAFGDDDDDVVEGELVG